MVQLSQLSWFYLFVMHSTASAGYSSLTGVRQQHWIQPYFVYNFPRAIEISMICTLECAVFFKLTCLKLKQEEHLISRLKFTSLELSCQENFGTKGSRVVFGTYYKECPHKVKRLVPHICFQAAIFYQDINTFCSTHHICFNAPTFTALHKIWTSFLSKIFISSKYKAIQRKSSRFFVKRTNSFC